MTLEVESEMNARDAGPDVRAHYAHGALLPAILDALVASGKNLDQLSVDDLAAVDEFHVRGREATRELANSLDLGGDDHVLDVGSGLGGAARRLAKEFGCRVTGVDLSSEYCRVAAALANLLGLSERLDFHAADASRLPFADCVFDIVWTQHVAMNVADKARLYREFHRVLRPGGKVAIYDVLQGPGDPVHYPTPWARRSDLSFLADEHQLRRLLVDSGFEIDSWHDKTESGEAWFRRFAARLAPGRMPLGIHLLFGDCFDAMAANQVLNLVERRVSLAQIIGHKPSDAPA